ncbi:unnamed protein product [Protopolystoma xenopodis]|uniref:SET domain-containing protein n=1 Tax=Protopolystoma xenopodis TaxID=117903 RepID=A0A3S5FDH6_9PLAT|nr:unnamed protein product [Protopolystoma xenopodis]
MSDSTDESLAQSQDGELRTSSHNSAVFLLRFPHDFPLDRRPRLFFRLAQVQLRLGHIDEAKSNMLLGKAISQPLSTSKANASDFMDYKKLKAAGPNPQIAGRPFLSVRISIPEPPRLDKCLKSDNELEQFRLSVDPRCSELAVRLKDSLTLTSQSASDNCKKDGNGNFNTANISDRLLCSRQRANLVDSTFEYDMSNLTDSSPLLLATLLPETSQPAVRLQYAGDEAGWNLVATRNIHPGEPYAFAYFQKYCLLGE